METKLKFKVGDIVKIMPLSWYDCFKNKAGDVWPEKVGVERAGHYFSAEMAEKCGDSLEIIDVVDNGYKVCGMNAIWEDWMLEDNVVTEEPNNMETKVMTRQEVLDFIKNKKIRCDSEQESFQVQEKLFELGIKLVSGGKELGKYYLLFINEKNRLTYCSDYNYWIEDVREELKVQDILSIRINEEPKPKFDPRTLKPFDQVLVRDNLTHDWRARFFHHLGEDGRFHVTNFSSYRYCIPYNDETKHLFRTNESEPEFYQTWK